jgi:hypothetical protein|tara:strand:+ start:631 stop:1125 length:495 start_codon:yes stop_codon:yes gene_type:complete
MGKKKTKPTIPGKRKAALTLAKIRIHKYKNRYATLWEAAKEFTKTKEYRDIIKIAKRQMVLKHGTAYYKKFRKDSTRQIKFVLNMFRDIKKVEEDYLTFWPKALYQTEETGFTPPKWIISMSKEIGKDGRAKPNKARLDYANFKRANKRPLKDRMKELKTFRKK